MAASKFLLLIVTSAILTAVGVVVPAAAGAAPGSWSYLSGRDAARWDPCRPIGYRVNPAQLPAGALAEVQAAVGRVASATGLTYSYLGTTTTVPGSSTHGGYPADAPLVIAWAKPGETRYLSGGNAQVVAYGGGSWTDAAYRADGSRAFRFVEGYVVMDSTKAIKPGFAADPNGNSRGLILQHEIGHTAGLGHTSDRSQIMTDNVITVANWGDGDRTGLTQLGRSQGCLSDTPEGAQPVRPATNPSQERQCDGATGPWFRHRHC